MPTRENMEIVRGDSKNFNITLKKFINGTESAINLTGTSVKFSIKKFFESSTVNLVLSSTNPNEIDITDAVNGKIQIKFLPANTKDLLPQTYIFDVEVTTVDADKFTTNIGEFTIKADITLS